MQLKILVNSSMRKMRILPQYVLNYNFKFSFLKLSSHFLSFWLVTSFCFSLDVFLLLFSECSFPAIVSAVMVTVSNRIRLQFCHIKLILRRAQIRSSPFKAVNFFDSENNFCLFCLQLRTAIHILCSKCFQTNDVVQLNFVLSLLLLQYICTISSITEDVIFSWILLAVFLISLRYFYDYKT